MRTHDLIYVGIKLLAVVFGVIGAVSATVVVAGILLEGFFNALRATAEPYAAADLSYNLFSLVQPLAFLLAAWFLARNTGLVFSLLRLSVPPADNEAATPAVRTACDH